MNEVKLVGILNLSYDSFSGDGVTQVDLAIKRAAILQNEGAWIVDVGAVSTKPYAKVVNENEEVRRIKPVLKELSKLPLEFGIDTTSNLVAKLALDNGAKLINSINASQEMYDLSRVYQVPVVIMHRRGSPQNMNSLAKYDNVVNDVLVYLSQRVELAKNSGCEKIIVDPGLGFAKLATHSWDMLRNLNELKRLECEIMVGASRKGFTHKSGIDGTIMANDLAYQNGATMFRVHDIKAHKDYFEQFYPKA